MKRNCPFRIARRLTAVLAVAASATVAVAHPYATALTNNAGTVSFRLNEAADNVKVIGNGGRSPMTWARSLAKGLTVTNLTASGLTGGVFSVVVTKAGSGRRTLISDPADDEQHLFYGPRALRSTAAPASPYFGRIYVGNFRARLQGGPPVMAFMC